ncbi:MAG: sigma-70 family RNA polymerase sigma factor [Chloroflexi bacterium]|nr:sigma-70 family RNA polymerase sigma factor [Chloroflexota bacterium]MBP8055522.1 sigma-70 family RNA polymerase sigma factor [Chloroflexota bacterium]
MGNLAKIAQLTDDELVQLCLERGERDDRLFQELMRRYQRLIWRVCYRFMGNGDDAEDLTQEVFFKVYRNLASFAGRSTFKTWIYRIAINTAQNELRARARRPQESETEMETVAEFMPAAETVEETILEKGRKERLAAAFATLRPDDVQILRYKDIEQKQYDEIADLLGIGLSAAKMRVQRARLALQSVYQQLSED